MPNWDIENEFKGNVCGVDEAGRGPWVGPVVAGAVIFLSRDINQELLSGINDSKKLSAKKREKLYDLLLAEERAGHITYGIGEASAAEIDELNILQATFLAMRRAAQKFLHIPDCCALIDGPYAVQGLSMRQFPVVDGDAKSLAIASASIIAKVTRDHYMTVLDQLYPGYGFAGHKGYGTAKHLAALRKLGPCPEHRNTFGPVRRLLTDTSTLP